MKKIVVSIAFTLLLIGSCNDEIFLNEIEEGCEYRPDISSPVGYEIDSIGKIDFNGSVASFQFVNDQIGYALVTNNVGGYVEVFKSIDGGKTWTDLMLSIPQHPRGMVFKNENIGIITVHDVTGCPPPNCQNKCVILKTEDGGNTWLEKEIEGLKGILYHPQYDSEGNLYAMLWFDSESTLMKSTNDGETWEKFYESTELQLNLVTYSFELFNNKLYLSGKDGKIIVIDINGSYLNTIETGGSSIWDLEIIDENNMIVVVSGKVIKSIDGGANWTIIYDNSARMIGFSSPEEGLMIFNMTVCPSKMVNDAFGSTIDGGITWEIPDETTTSLRNNFQHSLQWTESSFYVMIENQLLEIKKQ
jgi:photosystem II stability/assembly factor-like uncharacterized protein